MRAWKHVLSNMALSRTKPRRHHLSFWQRCWIVSREKKLAFFIHPVTLPSKIAPRYDFQVSNSFEGDIRGESVFAIRLYYSLRRWNLSAQQVVLGTFLLVFILVSLLYLGNTNQNSINWRCKSLQCDKVLAFVYECDNFAFVNYRNLVCSCLCKWLLRRCIRSHFRLAWL